MKPCDTSIFFVLHFGCIWKYPIYLITPLDCENSINLNKHKFWEMHYIHHFISRVGNTLCTYLHIKSEKYPIQLIAPLDWEILYIPYYNYKLENTLYTSLHL